MFRLQNSRGTRLVYSESREAIFRSFPFCTVSLDADDQVGLASNLGLGRGCCNNYVHLVGFLVGGSHLARMCVAFRFTQSAQFRLHRIDFGNRNSGKQVCIVSG